MNIDTQHFLDLVEETGKICFFDIEATGLRGDYNSTICVSIKPYGKEPKTFAIKQVGNDQRVVNEAKAELEKYLAWVTYYGKGFDVKFLNSRLLKWKEHPIDKRPHIDLYYVLKSALLTARRSQGHLLNWLHTDDQKMGVGADVWSDLPFKLKTHLPTMIERCESDTAGLEALYRETRHLIADIKR